MFISPYFLNRPLLIPYTALIHINNTKNLIICNLALNNIITLVANTTIAALTNKINPAIKLCQKISHFKPLHIIDSININNTV